VKVNKVRENIIQLDYDTQEELASSFLRFQEYYESPMFRNMIFTLGQFREWYSQEYGGFTYYQDWNGFNVPSYVLDTFRKGLFDPLTEAEKKILEVLPGSRNKYYVIGTHGGGDKNVLEHEICHGMFYTNQDYSKEVQKAMDSTKYKDLEPVFSYLSKMGYHGDVLVDEAHAYIGVDYKELEADGIGYPEKLRDKLLNIREKYGV